MKLATAKQIQDLRASSVKRRDYDELGPLLYDCWLIGIERYLEKRLDRQASSVKPRASSADHEPNNPQALSTNQASSFDHQASSNKLRAFPER